MTKFKIYKAMISTVKSVCRFCSNTAQYIKLKLLLFNKFCIKNNGFIIRNSYKINAFVKLFDI